MVYKYERAAAELSCALRQSQSNEDLKLAALLRAAESGFRCHQNGTIDFSASGGTFVELGALDGHSGSQSWMMEHCYGWKGLLIEGNPVNYKQLQLADRSNATLRQWSAVCSPPPGRQEGTVTFAGQEAGAVSGIASEMSKRAKGAWSHQLRGDTFQVPCAKLQSLMGRAQLDSATFLSLDVEGAELLVLQTFDGVQLPFDVIMVEADGHNATKDAKVESLIKESGMIQLPLSQHTGSHNQLYIRGGVATLEHRELLPHTGMPVNAMANFTSDKMSSFLKALSSQSRWNFDHILTWAKVGLPQAAAVVGGIHPAMLSRDNYTYVSDASIARTRLQEGGCRRGRHHRCGAPFLRFTHGDGSCGLWM